MEHVFGLDFYDKDINNLKRDLAMEIKVGKKKSIFTPNIDHIINNYNDSNVMKVYSESEYIIADGWPLVATAKVKKKNIERITGVDLMDELLDLADKNQYSVYFLGATDETLEKLRTNIKNKFPNIKNVFTQDGYFTEDEPIIKSINDSKVQILFVGMGNPKQEIWIRENAEKINVNLMLGIGGALKIFSNEVERAPKFVQKIGMEWFYRFLKEPKRLFSRYFIKYPKFIKILYKEITR